MSHCWDRRPGSDGHGGCKYGEEEICPANPDLQPKAVADGSKDLKILISKVNAGDGLSDSELTTAISFYKTMAHGLKALGAHFHHAHSDVFQTLLRLEDFQRARKQRF